MAQNSDALQEPSMDELLASIREIIEENTGIPPQDGRPRNADSAARPAHMEAAIQARSRSYDTTMPHLKQDIRVRNGGQNGGGAMPAAVNGGNPAAYKDARDGNGFSHNGQNAAGAYHNGAGNAPANTAGLNGFGAMPGGNGGARPNAAPRRSESQPVQDSMNALAERIGLRRNANAAPQNEPQGGRSFPAETNGAAQPPFIAAQANIGAGNAGHAPLPPVNANGYPRSGGQGANGQAMQNGNAAGQPRFNPAAIEAGFRDSAPNLAERNGRREPERLRNAEAKEAVPQAARQPRPQAAQKAGAEHSAESYAAEQLRSMEARIDAGDFDKTFADVEHSTENLLRPVIAQWLDEHFRGLFEKVLREEVQRFIRSMNRDR